MKVIKAANAFQQTGQKVVISLGQYLSPSVHLIHTPADGAVASALNLNHTGSFTTRGSFHIISLKLRQHCPTFDLQDQVGFEVAAHQTIRGDIPQLVGFVLLRGNTQPAPCHHHAA